MYDITALGELLIDFTESGISQSSMKLFEQNPGGAVANVLAAAARCGRKTAFIGKVGRDMHGLFLKHTLDDVGIDTCGLVLSDDVFTTLAFVALSQEGERTFSFARKPGADTCLAQNEVNENILLNTKIFHIGSLSLTDEPSRSTTYFSVRRAKEASAIISYDPNYRASLWPNQSSAIEQMRLMLPYVDIIKLSDTETTLLTDYADPEQAALSLFDLGIPCVAVTLGGEGTLICVQRQIVNVPGFQVPVRDTTGAGDAFWGGFLHKLLDSEKKPLEVSVYEAQNFAEWGNATAALCIQKRGAIPAMPNRQEIENLIHNTITNL